MKIKFIISVVAATILSSCVSIPKETISLSKVLGSDLVILHNSHRSVMKLFYGKIKEDIDVFIDDVYSPFVIHYVLKIELEKHKKGEVSLYTSIENAGKIGGKAETNDALTTMLEFQEAVNKQIQAKRKELLNPIIKQEQEIISNMNKSYENVIYANSTITSYLTSVRKVKESHQEALSIVGLQGFDTKVTSTLVKASELINDAVEKGKEIDIKNDEAYSKMEEISAQIKKIINKN
jgi:hypothetical protein